MKAAFYIGVAATIVAALWIWFPEDLVDNWSAWVYRHFNLRYAEAGLFFFFALVAFWVAFALWSEKRGKK